MSAPLEIAGPVAPPRLNGELVFAEPWQSRAFGIAVSLYEAGLLPWAAFQQSLIARIARWETAVDSDRRWSYYDHWLGALSDVLADIGSVSPDAVAQRAQSLAQRPAGHDHT